MEYTEIKNNLQKESSDSISVLRKKFSGLRTRSSSELVAPIMVSIYGQRMTINQLASITTPDARTINLQLYDKAYTKEVVKQISIALDLNPQHTEQHIIVNLPQLTEERRIQYVKKAKQYSEETKIAIRAHRKNSINNLNKLKDNTSQDELKRYKKNIEEQIAFNFIEVANMLKDKIKEVMSI